jgi:uncharacterized protein (TIGR03118 family)
MRIRKLLTMGIMFATGLVVGLPAQAASAHEAEGAFQQTNLVSNLPGLAPVTDPNLQNPWGMSSSPSSPIWVSDNNGDLTAGTGNASTLYTGAGQPVKVGGSQLVVKIPLPDGTDGGAPTGQVFNGIPGDFEGAPFIFATEDGTIAAWEPGIDLHHAQIEVDRSTIPTAANGAVYKGLAIGTNAGGQHLYAANFRAGTIDVFDASFGLVTLDGSFTDRRIPTGFAPFNIQNLGGLLYVTYAKQKPDKHDDLAGPGNGFVDVYDLNGHLLHRLVRRGELNSPWGLAIAPADFGPFGGDLLVGNFGDGRINVYTRHGSFRGALRNDAGAPIQISGLWGLRVGNGGSGGDVHTVFFTAGINEEKDGLFGTITSVGHDDD